MSKKNRAIARAAREELINRLIELYPLAFAAIRPPVLKVGIRDELIGAGFDPAAVAMALRRYCGSFAYLRSVMKAPHRVDLEGQPAGEITDNERDFAKERIAAMKAELAARKPKSAPVEVPPAPVQAEVATVETNKPLVQTKPMPPVKARQAQPEKPAVQDAKPLVTPERKRPVLTLKPRQGVSL